MPIDTLGARLRRSALEIVELKRGEAMEKEPKPRLSDPLLLTSACNFAKSLEWLVFAPLEPSPSVTLVSPGGITGNSKGWIHCDLKSLLLGKSLIT